MSSALKTKDENVAIAKGITVGEAAPLVDFDVPEFRRKLMRWYRQAARKLPWRGVDDPYGTWLSEIMLQQTRVATVIDRYQEFLIKFPTITDLAAADEDDVLALWSGLGYYRRARMLHRGAQFVEREMQGKLPRTAVELRTLPGVGDYTAAAIASIAFGESIAVLDGNVERVLLRLMGEAEEKSARARARLVMIAGMLTPPARRGRGAHSNPAGDHNQAMMELGAMICLPRSPLCLQCPVMAMCRTRGEHMTTARTKMQSRTVAHLLALRKRGVETEVLLERRPDEASLMAGMLELPALPLDAIEGREPALRFRHAITNTNYYVQIFTESVASEGGMGEAAAEDSLVEQIPAAKSALEWVTASRLAQLPLTGLTRKALQRLQVMMLPKVKIGRR
jgi:A/G-specific adenine glycosylase